MSDLIWHITECNSFPLLFALRKSVQCYFHAVSSEDPDFDTCEKWQVLWLAGLFFIWLVIGVFDVLRVALKALKRWFPQRSVLRLNHTHGFDVFFSMFSPFHTHFLMNESDRVWKRDFGDGVFRSRFLTLEMVIAYVTSNWYGWHVRKRVEK